MELLPHVSLAPYDHTRLLISVTDTDDCVIIKYAITKDDHVTTGCYILKISSNFRPLIHSSTLMFLCAYYISQYEHFYFAKI